MVHHVMTTHKINAPFLSQSGSPIIQLSVMIRCNIIMHGIVPLLMRTAEARRPNYGSILEDIPGTVDILHGIVPGKLERWINLVIVTSAEDIL